MSNAPPAYIDSSKPPLNLFPSLQNQRVVLCSSSPRRLQLLQQIGLEVEPITSNFPEDLEKSEFALAPWEYASRTATEKLLAVYKRLANEEREPRLLIAADTVILAGNRIVEKPLNPTDHLDMLKRLRQTSEHLVFTAVSVLAPDDEMLVAPGYIIKTHIEETCVTFDPEVSDDLLAAYVQSGEGSDKAGGYAIQGQGAVLVKQIKGSYDAVVGLPLNATYRLIQEVLNHDPYQLDDDDKDQLDATEA